jgi:LmbE family N-acetylglucosaminyl deacetylase
VRPAIVFTASPNDYMIDHEITSLVVQTACFTTGIKNMEVAEEPYESVPYLYYVDPLEGKDKFGNPVIPSFYVDITNGMKNKEEMLACHASQREWLRKHHKIDEYILAMKRFAEQQGKAINTTYAEGSDSIWDMDILSKIF